MRTIESSAIMLAFTIQCRGRKFYCPLLLLTSQFLGNFFLNLTCCLFVKSVSFESWLLISLEGPLSTTNDQKWSEWPNQWPPGPPGLLYLLSSSLSCLHCLFTARSLSWKSLNYKCKNQQTNQKNYNTNTSNKWNVQIFWGGLKLAGLFRSARTSWNTFVRPSVS